MIKSVMAFFVLWVIFFTPFQGEAKKAETKIIKISIVAPEGSSWVKIIKNFSQALFQKSKGRLNLRIYAGGVTGDEKDVIRKMRIGQIHAAGFTGVGLGEILPAVRILDTPFLFDNHEEIDYVTLQLFPYFKEKFSQKGFVLLGFAEVGFVNIFSDRPVKSVKDVRGLKLWAWEGDPLVRALCEAYNIVPVPLAFTDVLTSLQTNLINSFYCSSFAAIALQWFTRVKYMNELPIAHSAGAILITKQKYNSLPDDLREILNELSEKYIKILNIQIRKDNEESYQVLKKTLKFITFKKEEIKEIKEISVKVRNNLVGKLYDKKLLDEVLRLLSQARSKQPALASRKQLSTNRLSRRACSSTIVGP